MKKKILSMMLVVFTVMFMLTVGGCSKEISDEPTSSDEATTVAENTADTTNETTKPATQLSEKEKIVTVNFGSEPKAWDPSVDDSSGSVVISALFEGLLRDTPEGTLISGQAKEYEISEDGLTYTFKLRDDIFWSDGVPVTAYDFEYGWHRLIDPAQGANYSWLATPYIKNADDFYKGEVSFEEVGIKAIDDLTFQVELETPTPFFVNLMTFFPFMPERKDVVEKYGDGWEKNTDTCICNGPYCLDEYKIGDYLMLKKSESYYDQDVVKIDKVKLPFIMEGTTALNAFEAGDLDVCTVIPSTEVPRLIAEEPNLMLANRMHTEYVIFNVDKSPTDDVRVRKAFSLAIDRKALCDNVLKGGQRPATGVIPPVLIYSDGTSCRILDDIGNPMKEFGVDPSTADIEQAKALLAEAGYPNGEGFPDLTYTYYTSENQKKVAEALQEMWKNNLNINVKIENMEWQVLVEKRKNGECSISGGNWIGDYVDPMTFLDAYGSDSAWNECQWRWKESLVAPHDTTLNPSNKVFEEEIKLAQTTMGKERDAHLREAEKIIMDECVVAPTYYGTSCYLVNNAHVKGVWRTKSGMWRLMNIEIID